MIIAQALVTALLAGLFSGVVLFALNERRERTKLMLEKTESAIESYAKWTETLSRWPITHYDMFFADRASGREAAQRYWTEAREHYFRAQALIGIYLPEESDAISNVAQVALEFMPFHKEGVKASLANDPFPTSLGPAIEKFNANFVEVSGAGLGGLLAAARRHASEQFVVKLPRLSRKGIP